jgi:hypothetical protein
VCACHINSLSAYCTPFPVLLTKQCLSFRATYWTRPRGLVSSDRAWGGTCRCQGCTATGSLSVLEPKPQLGRARQLPPPEMADPWPWARFDAMHEKNHDGIAYRDGGDGRGYQVRLVGPCFLFLVVSCF